MRDRRLCRINLQQWLLGGASFGVMVALSSAALAQTPPQLPPRSAGAVPAEQSPEATQGAQSATPAAPATEGFGDIVVTARYVREDIQKTPMAISAQSNEQLEAAHVTNVGNLGAVIPNLYSHPPLAQASGPVISMRGVLQDQDSFAIAPAVALYVDDVYHATVVGSGFDLTDVDHIEVLRGPQSTLSGNASIGGAIKIYTKDPVGDGSGDASLQYGSRNLMKATGAIDLGLTDTLAVRVSGHIQKQDGYVKMLDFTCEMNKLGTPGLAGSFPAQPDAALHGCKVGELGGGTQGGGQVKVRWRPTSDIDLLITAAYDKADMQETPELLVQAVNPNPNPSTLIEPYNQQMMAQYGIRFDSRFLAPPGQPYSVYSSFCRPQFNAVLQAAPYAASPSGFCYPRNKEAENTTISGRLKWRLSDDINMTAIASWSKFRNNFTQNGEESPLGYVLSHFDQYVTQKTGELRFDGKLFDNKLDWVVGGYILRYNAIKAGFIGYVVDNFTQNDLAHTGSQSGFVHLDFHATDRWRISGGGRYTDGSIRYSLDHPPLITVPFPFTSTYGRWDWLISTDYQITNSILAYASAATGSRPAGVTDIIITPQQLTSTPGEDLISYEVGVKSDLIDHHLRVNLAGFLTDYKSILASQGGVQCLGQLPAATWHPSAADCTTLYPSNPGNVPWFISTGTPATIKGFEWDISALPVDHLRIDWSGGYNHFTSRVHTPGLPGYIAPGNVRVPEWNMHAAIRYDVDTQIGKFTPRVDWNWQSEQDFDTESGAHAARPQYIIHPYSLFNAGIEYETKDRKWSATFNVANLANKFYYYQLFDGTQLAISSPVGPPREFSLTVRRHF
jgi:iron complex outermembrane receptor protein